MNDTDVRIGDVHTDVTVTDGAGPLSAQDMKTLVAKVLEHVRREREQDAQRDQDTRIHDRAFRPQNG
jgi:hypothetical protein